MTEETNPHFPYRLSDPTELTTQMVAREVSVLDDKMNDAIAVRHNDQKALKELLLEKFKSIETQFELIERQRIEQKLDTKQAVDAALIAQKEAVHEQTVASGTAIGKSEDATIKLLDTLGNNITTAIAGVTQTALETKDTFNTAISDLKGRVDRMEATKVGITEERTHTKENVNMSYMLIGIVIGLVSIASLVVAIFK